MANSKQTVVLRGVANYAKILGDPVPNFGKDGLEWKMELIVDKSVIKEMKAVGIADRVLIKADYLDGRPFMRFKHKAKTAAGKNNKPIPVKDILGDVWPDDNLIGNGSVVDVKFDIVDYGVGMKKGVYIRSVRVLDHVPYNRQDFVEVNEEDEYFKKAMEAKKAKELVEFQKDFSQDEELDDSVEFDSDTFESEADEDEVV